MLDRPPARDRGAIMSSTPHPGAPGAQTPLTATPTAAERRAAERSSDFPTGWILFTAVTLLMSGGMTVLFGLAALLNDKVVSVGGSGGPVILDITAWGWLLLVGGIVMGLTGIALALQVGVARWLAAGFVTLHAIGMFAVATEFPVLAILVIALDVVILYELTVQWGRSR
jgi:hypothetical protein